MGTEGCRNCQEYQARITELERRVAELEARLGNNSSNSSIPPSANPLDAPKPVTKKKSKRRRGGQPGHPPHLKRLLPPARVTKVIPFRPERCDHCRADLRDTPVDPQHEPTRFQVIEIPPIVCTVTEYQGLACTCPGCGGVTRAAIPQEVRQHSVGPRMTSVLSYLAGCHGLSKRGIEEIAEVVFAGPVALGTVANLEREVSQSLAAPHAEALEAVRQADVKNADETSWKRGGKLCWLWAAATVSVVAFVIHAKRSALGLAALLGSHIHGIVCSDRWGPYGAIPEHRRQLCWAHLKRDFQKIVDRGGESAKLGQAGLRIVKKVFAAWHEFKENGGTRDRLKEQLAPVIKQMNRLLLKGWVGDDAAVSTFCKNLLEVEHGMWTFTREEGVEPTNNHIERLLRRAVLWRKRSFGSQSEAGCRFVERILTVVQTCRLQDNNALEFLCRAVVAHRANLPAPKLLPQG